jgi:phosphonate transport system substrate-binding protein
MIQKFTIAISLFMVLFNVFICAEVKSAGKQQPEKSFVIGLIPEHHIFEQVERYEPLAGYISKKMGMKIKLKILTRYGNIIDNFVSLGLDGAFFGSFTYALAHRKIGVQVLARPESLNGRSTYYGLIFTRKDSGIKNIRDMKEKRFAFVDKATTAGYLLPLAYFRKHGIDNYRTYFKETYFTGTHEDAIYDVLNRKAEIGAAKNTVYERISKTDKRIQRDLIILERSPDVPENGLAVRSDLDIVTKKRLKEVLLNMQSDPKGKTVLKNFGAWRFIETTDKDYDAVFKYAAEINLDLKTYDYMND